ncbi:uncharacterized protein [Chironomus tepperi]|uniref:uncharacterized protein n=1 Tax=Chironomus tepperi TaxID=113505 RepID=UPI00391FC70B
MKNFTLTLLACLLIQWCTLHKISCTTVAVSQNRSDVDHHSPLSEDNLLKVSATNAVSNSTDHNSYSDSASSYVNEKKSERNQRTLYRRAGGHLRSDVSSTPTTETTSQPHRRPTVQSHLNEPSTSREVIHTVNSNSIKNHQSYFRRKTKTTLQPSQHNSSSSHRDENVRGSSSNKVINVTILDSSDSKEINDTNDDENSLDYGLMAMSAAGEGKDDEELAKTSFKDIKKDEKVKTLSDQIAEGKYGLIEKEIFSKAPKAPGIISYKTNSETPDDNEKTLGGLSKDEIWLAEDHLLVLKGGIANDKKNKNEEWRPIDDYEAPKRPVKIPLNPRVPPPFPVQLTKDGPLQFIGHNKFSIFNPFTNETGLFANANGHITPINQANSEDTKNTVAGLGAVKNNTKDKIHEVIPPPPWLFHNSYKDVDLLKHFPFNLPLPDQALNRTEDFDEDDPSLFYPPPYSFVYKTNYTNLAPVGPLVPGIILPPPPDFFSVYDPEEEKKPIKTPLDAYHRIKDIQLKNRLSATTSAPSTTTEQPPRSSTASYIRDFTRKTKQPSSTVSTTKLYKTKTTTVRPVTIHSSTVSPSTTPNEILNYKTHHYDTSTLRLHPVYIPPSMSTKLYSTVSTTTTTTQAPIEPQNVKQYQKDYGTQHHPIYFEYFDARTANPINGNPYVGPEYDTSYVNGQSTTSSTTSPPPVQPIAVFNSPKVNKKPKSFYPPQYISTTISPANIDAKYLFVTPKPDIFGTIIAPQKYPITTDSPISYNTALPVQKPLILKPVGKFEDEIASIKQTLDYYNTGSKHKHAQKPKVKAVYEFSFEASKHKNNQHQQPSQEEFQPMLSYDQKNAHLTELINTNSYYPTSSEPSMKYYRAKQSATLPPKKKNAHMESSVSSAPQSMHYGQKLRQQNLNYYGRPIFKEVVSSPQQSQKIVLYPSQSSHDIQSSHVPINVDQHGYRINSKNIKYRNSQQQSQQQQQQYYGPASEVISLINDTLVNYKPPQRPINPLSEFIDVSRFPQSNPTPQTGLRPQNNPPYIPYIPHPSQIPQQQPVYPGPFQRPQQHFPQQSQQHFPQQSQQHFPQQSQQHFPQQSQQHFAQQSQQHFQQQSHQNYHPSASHASLDVVNYPIISQINPESVHITFYNRPLEKSDDGKF